MKPKTKIVLASLLKPVNDPRMFEKFGVSLSVTNRYDIHIIGFDTDTKLSNPPNVQFHPMFKFRRISWYRFWAPLKYYTFLLKVKPEVIIVNAPDLLIVTVLYKIIFGSKMLYDVQENYLLNILYTDAFKPVFRPFLGFWVRLQEILVAPFVDHFFLAEKIYVKQLSFVRRRATIIENKYQPILPLPNKSGVKMDPNKPLNLIFTGTLSRHYGVIDAIEFTNRISIYHPVSLKITGRCANTGFLNELKALIADNSRIQLIGGEFPVSHIDIVEAINKADMGIISYLPNKSTWERTPTKVFEYMANNLPFFVLYDPVWLEFASEYHACLPINPDVPIIDLLNSLYAMTFYDVHLPLNELLWENEEEKLLDIVSKLFDQ